VQKAAGYTYIIGSSASSASKLDYDKKNAGWMLANMIICGWEEEQKEFNNDLCKQSIRRTLTKGGDR
jgi:hypothetical protein